MNHMSSLPRLQQMQYSPYGHLPPTYLPAFSDGSQTYIPTLGSRAHHHFSSSMIHPNTFTSSQHNPRYPAMYPYQTQPHDLPGMATNAPGINGCPRPDGRDVAMGMLAGAAVGSMMYGPYFWWWRRIKAIWRNSFPVAIYLVNSHQYPFNLYVLVFHF